MARQPRKISASGIHHVIWRGIDKRQLFYDDIDNVKFLTLINFVTNENLQVLAYCLMGNHVHLLVKTEKGKLSKLDLVMKRLGIMFSSYYNKRYDRVGSVFQGRFKSVPVETRLYFLRVLRYIHANPIEARIVDDLNNYQWSSYIDYFSKRAFEICKVNINYALQFCDVDWLLNWHSEPETSKALLSDYTTRVSDDEALQAIKLVELQYKTPVQCLSLENRNAVLRRLVQEDGVYVPQLSRLTGISRGEIQRCLF